MFVKANPQTLLEALPQKPRQIARFFKEQGITGANRVSPTNCPVALYLKKYGYDASVSQGDIVIFNLPSEGRRWSRISTTPALESFITAFDIGWYRYLRKNKR